MKILFDISILKAGFSGIPQDARRIFTILKSEDGLQLDALVMDDTRGIKLGKKINSQSDILSLYRNAKDMSLIYGLNKPIIARFKFLSRLLNLLTYLRSFFIILGGISISKPITNDKLLNLWAEYFEQVDESITVERKLTNLKFANISRKIMNICGTLGINLKIDTRGYDFFFSPMPCVFRVSQNTQLVVRYHDAIPITNPELVNNPESKMYTFKALKNCVEQDAIFVCNSHSSELELKALFPENKLQCLTIPCSTPESKIKTERIRYSELLDSMGSTHADYGQTNLSYIEDFFARPYLISIGNIEPKKNQERLLKALIELHSEGSTVNLVLIGNKGWKSDAIMRELSKAIRLKRVLHLQNVVRSDLDKLILQSGAYIFPSLVEGFGMGIAEAMAHKKLVLCSDIPAHQYVTDGNALFFNPYSNKSIMSAIMKADQLIALGEHNKIVNDAFIRSQKYSMHATRPLWRDLFLQTK